MDYNIELEPVFGGLKKVDWREFANSISDDWWNRTICQVNDSLVRIGVFKGEFHWHRHDDDDEYFHVLSGLLLLDFEDETVELGPAQSMLVPKGVKHRTRAKERTVVLMIESSAIQPEGD